MIIPLPVRVEVMVMVKVPVRIMPANMSTVVADVLLFRVTLVDAVDLLTVRMLNVVAPVIFALWAPRNCTVPAPAVKLPELVQSR